MTARAARAAKRHKGMALLDYISALRADYRDWEWTESPHLAPFKGFRLWFDTRNLK